MDTGALHSNQRRYLKRNSPLQHTGNFWGDPFESPGDGPDEHHKTNSHVAATLHWKRGRPARTLRVRSARRAPTCKPLVTDDRLTAFLVKCEVTRLNSTSLIPIYCDKLQLLDRSF